VSEQAVLPRPMGGPTVEGGQIGPVVPKQTTPWNEKTNVTP